MDSSNHTYFNKLVDTDQDDFDVIIIGGGLTGLTSAYNILKKHAGLSVLIIEQHDKVGGRLLIDDVGFYANSFQKHICRLIDQLDLIINHGKNNDDKQRVFYTKNGPDMDEISSIDACQIFYFIESLHTSSMESRFKLYSTKDFDCRKIAEISVNDFLRQNLLTTKAKALCQSMIYAVCGARNLENISCLWLFVMLHNSGGFFQRFKLAICNNTRYFIKGGMIEIVNRLRDNIVKEHGIIHCSEVVKKINFNEIRVWITTTLKTYKCSYVIIAIPPPTNMEIIIEPILSDNILTTQTLYHTEKNIYFQAKYKSSFWDLKYCGSIISTFDSGVNLKIAYNASHKDNEEELNILAGFLTKQSNESSKLLNIFHTINKSFGFNNENIAHEYIEYKEYECQNPMAILKPCSIDHHINPMLKPFKRIYFASSEYAREFPGTADGAIEAGEHVACFVLHHVRPQVLDISQLIEYLPPKTSPKYELFTEKDWAGAILMITNVVILITFFQSAYFS
ncbi:hypothetical protein PV328_011402 [Microctonus aethiopoides]|uniref:Amine oxidase n=2 Tax=Microctonus aethiopoides TaxID=144406 RepID=A0AA39EYF6_9HYME|nr:hypothetical protein PV328_011402 [Microctonus aethiopoides]